MALECVEGADMTGISDERGRRACGAAGFVRVGRLPDPARLLRRDRSSSAPRSVQFRAEIGLAGSRPAAGVTRRASLHETGISARVQRARRRTHAEMSSSMCRGGAPVGLFLRGRRTGLLGQRPPCLTALFLRGRGTGPAPGPGAVVGLEQECSCRRGYQRQILKEAEDTLGMPASARPPVRAERPRPRQAHRPGRGPHPYARPHPASGTRSHSS